MSNLTLGKLFTAVARGSSSSSASVPFARTLDYDMHEPPRSTQTFAQGNIGHRGGQSPAVPQDLRYNESLALLGENPPPSPGPGRIKRKLLWVEFNGRADVVDLAPTDSVALVLRKIQEAFRNQLRFIDSAQLRMKIPGTWVPGSLAPHQSPTLARDRNREPSDLRPAGSPPRRMPSVPVDPAVSHRELRHSHSAGQLPVPGQGGHGGQRPVSTLSSQSGASGSVPPTPFTGPPIYIPSRKFHEGVSIGEVIASIISHRNIDTGMSPLFTATQFPAIAPMLNTREEAFEIFIDESTLPQNFSSTAGISKIPQTNEPDIELIKFWQQLRHARLEDDILSLPAGTYFLGDPVLGSKLYVRQVYKELALGIEQSQHWQRGFVVTGTPGMGKTFFGIWMLYLIAADIIQLPCEVLPPTAEEVRDIVITPSTQVPEGANLGNQRFTSSMLCSELGISASSSYENSSSRLSSQYFASDELPAAWQSTSDMQGGRNSMQRLADKPIIIWDSHLRNELIVFSMVDGSVTTGWSRRSSHPAFYHTHVWYISDGDMAPLSIPGPTVGTSRQINIRKILHLTSSDMVPPAVQRLPGYTILTLPSWKYSELEYLYYGNPAKYSQFIPYDVFTELVFKWGGNPLLVLAQSRSGDMQRLVETSLDRLRVAEWLDFALGLQAHSSNVRHANEWHMLGYLLVHASTESQDYVVRTYRLASVYIAQVLARLLYQQRSIDQKITESINPIWRFRDAPEVDRIYPHLLQVRKMLYLGFVHNQLLGGGVFRVRRLDAPKQGSAAAAQPDVQERLDDHRNSETQTAQKKIRIDGDQLHVPAMNQVLFDTILNLSMTGYNVPKVSHFSPVDAICAPGDLFCICVNSHGRSVRADRLRELHDSLQSALAEAAAAEPRPSEATPHADSEEITPVAHRPPPSPASVANFEPEPQRVDDRAPAQHRMRLFYAVPTDELFEMLERQKFKGSGKPGAAEQADPVQWADDQIEQYVVRISI
ncbi:hypothetical protein HK105_201743 [Polyrhizophydium stewartii]|uniref:Uncharacterized protein n=1 Tax=Polyrhizophydium stewartii TaxID=2732419 RepID=A0ABR4NH98_9FUNG